MYKITKILDIKSYEVICEIDDNMVFKIDIKPLIIKHKNFNGIEKLNDEKTFKIGEMGELCWKNLIFLNDEYWNYDISPEFIVANGIKIEMNHA